MLPENYKKRMLNYLYSNIREAYLLAVVFSNPEGRVSSHLVVIHTSRVTTLYCFSILSRQIHYIIPIETTIRMW